MPHHGYNSRAGTTLFISNTCGYYLGLNAVLKVHFFADSSHGTTGISGRIGSHFHSLLVTEHVCVQTLFKGGYYFIVNG